MGFDHSTSAVWERGHNERLLGQLWLMELVLPSCVANAHQSDPGLLIHLQAVVYTQQSVRKSITCTCGRGC